MRAFFTAEQISAAINVLVIVACGFVLNRALRHPSASLVHRAANGFFAALLTVIAIALVLKDPKKTEINTALVGQIVAAAFTLLPFVVGLAHQSQQHAAHPTPDASPPKRNGVEENRRQSLFVLSALFMIGAAMAITGTVVPPLFAGWERWPWVVPGCALSVAATALMITILRGRKVPDETAVLQNDRWYGTGERYLPLDNDRVVSLRVRLHIAEVPARQEYVYIRWRPDPKRLQVYLANFATDDETKLRLTEIAQTCTVRKIAETHRRMRST